MKRSLRTIAVLSAAVLAGALALVGPPARAAGPNVDARLVVVSLDPTARAAETRTFSRDELRGFVIAAVRIDRVLRRRGAAAAGTLGAAHKTDRVRVRTIIEATPRIDRARYRAIAEAVRTDPVLRTRLRQVIQELRHEQHKALRPLAADSL
jgi:hypothetical protein